MKTRKNSIWMAITSGVLAIILLILRSVDYLMSTLQPFIFWITTPPNYYIVLSGAFLLVILLLIVRDYFRVHFHYPVIKQQIDLSGRREPTYGECFDEWLLSLTEHGRTAKKMYRRKIEDWDDECMGMTI